MLTLHVILLLWGVIHTSPPGQTVCHCVAHLFHYIKFIKVCERSKKGWVPIVERGHGGRQQCKVLILCLDIRLMDTSADSLVHSPLFQKIPLSACCHPQILLNVTDTRLHAICESPHHSPQPATDSKHTGLLMSMSESKTRKQEDTE